MTIDRLPGCFHARRSVVEGKPQIHRSHPLGNAVHGHILTPQPMKPTLRTPGNLHIAYAVKAAQSLVVNQGRHLIAVREKTAPQGVDAVVSPSVPVPAVSAGEDASAVAPAEVKQTEPMCRMADPPVRRAQDVHPADLYQDAQREVAFCGRGELREGAAFRGAPLSLPGRPQERRGGGLRFDGARHRADLRRVGQDPRRGSAFAGRGAGHCAAHRDGPAEARGRHTFAPQGVRERQGEADAGQDMGHFR